MFGTSSPAIPLKRALHDAFSIQHTQKAKLRNRQPHGGIRPILPGRKFEKPNFMKQTSCQALKHSQHGKHPQRIQKKDLRQKGGKSLCNLEQFVLQVNLQASADGA